MHLSPILLFLAAAAAVPRSKSSTLDAWLRHQLQQAPLAELAERAPEALADLEGVCTDLIPSVAPFLLYLHYIMPLTKTGSAVLLTGTGSVMSRTETSSQTPQVDFDLIVETSKTWIDAGSSWS
ncbi:hypothetical protein OG21DRAFT_1604570 [Imleria badia]|nr:hypothetical protein OG21DRAFT_1604570 [Imleria badia]